MANHRHKRRRQDRLGPTWSCVTETLVASLSGTSSIVTREVLLEEPMANALRRERFAVGPSAYPIHGTASLQIDFEFGSRKDDAVGFGGYEAVQPLSGGGGDVENKV